MEDTENIQLLLDMYQTEYKEAIKNDDLYILELAGYQISVNVEGKLILKKGHFPTTFNLNASKKAIEEISFQIFLSGKSLKVNLHKASSWYQQRISELSDEISAREVLSNPCKLFDFVIEDNYK